MYETELERLERLAYLKDEDPSYKKEWKKLRDKLWNDKKSREFATRNAPVLVFLANGERKTYRSKKEVRDKLSVNSRTLTDYMDTDKPVSRGNAKGCYFYSLPKEEE